MSNQAQVERLLDDLQAAGIILVIARDRLQVTAPPEALTSARKAAIAEHRQELKTLVASRWRSREECRAEQPCRRMTPCVEPVYGRPCGIPATCCVCGAPLPHDRRMLCVDCSGEFTSSRTQPTQGDQS